MTSITLRQTNPNTLSKRGLSKVKAKETHLSKRKYSSHLLNNSGQHPRTEITTLDNKVRVATEAFHSGITTLGVYIDAGSSYENEKNNGTAHFLEHMAFKGTPHRTQQGIELEVENIGARLNAYTGREQTAYIAQCTNEHVEQMVDLLSDILLRSNYSPRYIESERDVILQEKERVEDEEDELIFDHVHACAFKGQTLGRPILGEDKHIHTLTKNDLVEFVQTHYTGPRVVIASSGGVDHKKIVEFSDKYFGGLSGENRFDMEKYKLDVKFNPSQIILDQQKFKDMRVVYAFEGCNWTSPDLFVQLVVQILLGHWSKYMAGATMYATGFAQTCSEKNLANNFLAYNTCYKHSGLVGIQANVPKDKMEEFSVEMVKEFKRLGTMLTQEELDVAKHKALICSISELNSTELIAEEIGRQILTLNRRMSPYEISLRIDKITVEDVYRYLHNVFFNSPPAIVYYGPKESVPNYNSFTEQLRFQLD